MAHPGLDDGGLVVGQVEGRAHVEASDVASADFFIVKGSKDRALIIYGGMNGSLFGYAEKYLRIAQRARAEQGVSVFGFANPEGNWNLKDHGFDALMQIVTQNMNPDFDAVFFGFSAGASFGIFEAWRCPQVKAMLLVNPPLMMNYHRVIDGIDRFTGASTLIVGERDQSIAFARLIEQEKAESGFSEVFIYPGADHNFVGLLDDFIELPLEYLFDQQTPSVNRKSE